MGGEAQPERVRLGPERRQLLLALSELTPVVEVRQVGMGAVGHRAAREPVDADVDAVEVVEGDIEQVERRAQVRPRLPAARVGRPQPAASEDLDGEAQPVRVGQGRSTARRGPARKPASTSSGMISVSITGLPVEALDREAGLAAAALHVRDERLERRSQPRLVGLAQRHERAAAALDEERGLAAEQDDVRAGDAGRARSGALRPRQRRAVGLGRVGGGEHERLLVVALAAAQLAEPLDRAGERELRPAEALDEVAAAADADRLESLAARRRRRRSRRGSPRRARRRA